MSDNTRLKVGDFITHFKRGTLPNDDFTHCYIILAVSAIHTETEESLLVYQAMYGDNKVFCRPMSMALSKVDKEKYPNSEQYYRLEVVQNIKLLASLREEYNQMIFKK